MTANMKALTEDATKAGYTVELDGTDIRIVKRVGRRKKLEGIVISETGTALLIDVRLDVAKGMRSYKDMRRVLGLKS